MKKIIAGFCLLTAFFATAQINSTLANYADDIYYNAQKQVTFVSFKPSYQVNETDVADFINTLILANSANKVVEFKVEKDELGFTHTKYQIFQNGVLVFNKLIIAHCKNGKLISLNGDLYAFDVAKNAFSLTESAALNLALKKVNAQKYKWENKIEEQHMREVLNQPDFSYYPKATKVIFEKEGKLMKAFQFNIYAETPLYRANVFVDASTGKILAEQNLICTINAPATAATKYSGTQTFTCDQNGATYRLRETGRGLGIETYNLNNSTTYSNTDFTNASTSWTTTGFNQAATDAHWGAESTYDFFLLKFNRNSIDNAGFKLLSYMHYNTNYNNAFWDGQRMTYGDGNGTAFTVFTALDVCGHEITHGLVSNTAGLNGGGTGEADALNEGFADIFGASVERFARPGNWNWKMGSDITVNGNGIRNMQNPKILQDPDTYAGQYWDFNGEPHNNAGPSIKWFYLLVNGGTGTNDLNNLWSVSGLGNVDAEKIAYRALTNYFTPGTNYANARISAIQAAKDLFGNCSNQVTQTTNAWYAVGVGAQYIPGQINPNFDANATSFCTLPANISFNNTTLNGNSFTWDFGDGSSANTLNASHTYTANGTYSVKLKAVGCGNVVDSLIKNGYIVINVPNLPSVTGSSVCGNSSVVLTASGNATLKWFSSPTSTTVINTGNTFNTPNLNSNTTYYVANTVSSTPVFGGLLSNTGGGYLNNAAQYLNFDVFQSGVLNSVVVYAQAAGTRVFELRDAGSNVLNTSSFNLSAGANTVTLNYNLVPGTNYQLGLSGGSTANLYRTNTNVGFPYNIGGIVNITGSNAGSTYYYFFYKWKVTKTDCSSALVAVTATVYPAPQVSISAGTNVVCLDDAIVPLTGSPSGGNFGGNGLAGASGFAPSTGVGNYSLFYVYTDAAGCSGSDSLQMQVAECTGINSLSRQSTNMSVFPNPAKEFITLTANSPDLLTIEITDALGRVVLSKKDISVTEKIYIGKLANGMYVVSIKDKFNHPIKAIKFLKE